MNRLSYYANLLLMPLFFVVVFVRNMWRLSKQAYRWSIVETKSGYYENRRAHKLVDYRLK